MNNLTQKVFSDTLKLTSGGLVLRSFNIFFLIVYARLLTPFELSVIPVFGVIGGMSTLVFNFGVFSTIVREVPKLLEKNRKKAISLLQTSLFIVTIGAGIFSMFAFTFSGEIAGVFFKENKFAYLIKLMSVGFFLEGFNTILTFNMRAVSEFGKLTLKTIASQLIGRALSIILYLLWGITGLIIGLNFGAAIGVFLSLYWLRSYLFKTFRLYPIRELLTFGFPYYIENYLHYFRNHGDQLIIGAFLNPAALSAYYIARRLFDNLHFFSESIHRAVIPALSKISASGPKRLEQSFTKITMLLSYFAIPLSLLGASLSFAFVDLAGGEKYLNASVAVAILCFTMLWVFFIMPITGCVFVLGKPVDRLKITAVQSFSILIFLILLIKNFGITGVAFSRLLAVLTTFAYGYFALRRLMVIKLDAKAIIDSLFASIVMTLIISLAQLIHYRLYLVPLYTVIGISTFFFILAKRLRSEELGIIEGILPRRINGIIQILYWLRPSLNLKSRI